MSDTTVTTEAPNLTSPTPLPNDPAARSPTGEILDPSAIETKPTTPSANPEAPPAPTSTDPKPEPPKVPDAYTAFTAPDGYTISKEVIDAATPIFKELGLNQDQAQKLVDFHTQQMLAAAKGPEESYATMRKDWVATASADPDLKSAQLDGKSGLDAVKLGIGKTLAALGDAKLTQDFKDAMNLTGAGDHPAFIKAMWKLSQFVTEGKHVSGSGPSPHGQSDPAKGPPQTGAHALYPNLPQ